MFLKSKIRIVEGFDKSFFEKNFLFSRLRFDSLIVLTN